MRRVLRPRLALARIGKFCMIFISHNTNSSLRQLYTLVAVIIYAIITHTHTQLSEPRTDDAQLYVALLYFKSKDSVCDLV